MCKGTGAGRVRQTPSRQLSSGVQEVGAGSPVSRGSWSPDCQRPWGHTPRLESCPVSIQQVTLSLAVNAVVGTLPPRGVSAAGCLPRSALCSLPPGGVDGGHHAAVPVRLSSLEGHLPGLQGGSEEAELPVNLSGVPVP